MYSVSIVICTFNRASYLGDTLQSLIHLKYPEFEVIVVNGPSTDGTNSVLEKWADKIKVISHSQSNLAIARNIGIAAAAGDICAFIDDDAIPHPQWLKSLIHWFHDERVAGVGGYTIDHTGVNFQVRKTVCDRFGNAFYIPDWFDERPLCFPGTPYYPSLLGTNAAFRTSVLRQIGGWDETFALYLDETDVCLRMVDEGYRIVYESSALIYHQFAASDFRDRRRIARTLYPQAVSKAYFIMRHGTCFGIGRASKELEKYEQEVGNSQRWLRDHGEISKEHCFSLIQDLFWGMARGVDIAKRGIDYTAGDRIAAAPKSEFKSFERSTGLAICMMSQGFPPTIDAGIARWTQMVATGLVQRGHRVHVVTRSADGKESIRFEQGIWIHRCVISDEEGQLFAERYGIPLSIAEWCARAYREVQLIKTFGLDLVSFPIWDLEGIGCLDDPDIVTSISLHTTYALAEPFKPEWTARPIFNALHVKKMIAAERDCLLRASIVLGNSKQVVNDIERQYQIELGERCIVVPHGTHDLVASSPPSSNTSLRVFYVGRFETRKGFDIALDVANRALAADSACEFWFAGSELDINVIHLVSELGWRQLLSSPKLRFLGILSRLELERCYRECDVVLMPSRYESFGLVAIEAMAAGKPVIALDIGGLREIVVDGVNGLLVPLDDTAAGRIAGQLIRLSHDASTLGALACGARKTYLNNFRIDEMVDRIEAVFRRGVNRAGFA